MVLSSYAKINLSLRINSKRKDGLHEIQARYYWNYVLNLEKAEDELKKVIEEKLTKGL